MIVHSFIITTSSKGEFTLMNENGKQSRGGGGEGKAVNE